MVEQNPYASPIETAATEQEHRFVETGPAASRWHRFVARFMDNILLGIIFYPIFYLVIFSTGVIDLETLGDPERSDQTFAPLGIIATVISGVAVIALYLALNGYLLHTAGQTLGKRAMKIKIQRIDGSPPDIVRFFFVRELPFMLVGYLPYFLGAVISLIDTLLIFRPHRNCLHDDLAGTCVVSTSSATPPLPAPPPRPANLG